MTHPLTPADRLEVRRWSGGFGVFDPLTRQFVKGPKRSRYHLQRELQGRRDTHRPLIVRWLYGLPTSESRALGVTEEAA